jgi:hypothetical protein
MSFELPDGPPPELTTTRVASGVSALLVAVAVAGVLVGVVGFAFVNRPPARAPVAVAPTEEPTVPQVTPDARTAVFQVVPDGASPVYDGYGVELVIAGRRYPGQLFGAAADHLSTAFSVPETLAGGEATLHLAKVSSSYSHDIVAPIGDWQVPLARLESIRAKSTLLDKRVEAEPLRVDAPSLVQAGYEIIVRASPAANSAHLLAIDVLAHPAVRNQIEGNDGIFGWPVVAQLGQQRGPREYRYEVSMVIVGGLVRVPLEPSSLAEVHNGTVFVGTADVGPTLALEISRTWTQGRLLLFEPFDAWTIGLKPLRKSRGGMVQLLVAHVPPAEAGPNGPDPVASGYTLTVLGSRQGTELTLSFELVWPLATQPSQPIAYVGPRDPALYNRCRWDIGPLSAPPRPGTNEADC